MRIGIDARPLIQAQRTGIANYVFELIKQLPQVAPEHDYILYAHNEIKGAPCHHCVQIKVDRKFCRFPGSFWLLARGRHLIRRDRLDVFWSTATVLPLWVPKNVFKVVTVHDVIWRRFPETMQIANLWLHRSRAETAIRSCDRMIAVSRSTADDVVRFFGVPSERIKLVHPGISEAFKPLDPLWAAEQISQRYGVAPRYMAAVGTVEPRKNLTLLVRAVQMLKRRGQLNCPLLIAGASGWKHSPLYQQVRESGLSQEEIRFLGFVPDEDLPLFYAGAQAFLFPSVYEGFGLPPLEAMACGTPVIASNAPPMPETLGDAAILVPPCSVEGFAEATAQLVTDEGLRRTMQEKGFRRVERFRPQVSARQFLAALGCN